MWKCGHCETLNEDERNACVVCSEARVTLMDEAAETEKQSKSGSHQLTYIGIITAAIVLLIVIITSI